MKVAEADPEDWHVLAKLVQEYQALGNLELRDAARSELLALRHRGDNPELAEATRFCRMQLTEAGHKAYFAGGAVRDMIMGADPMDIDIATSATPDQVTALFRRTVSVGAAFGVIVVLEGDVETQVATFRSDGAYIDGRHPVAVRFSTAKEDVERRDFTINGLLYDPIRDKILDYVGGQDDLKARRLRLIFPEAVREDPLRMLRALGLVARFGFILDSDLEARLCADVELLREVSPERIAEEFTKIFLLAETPSPALRLMERTGILDVLLPELRPMVGCDQPGPYHAYLLEDKGQRSSIQAGGRGRASSRC